MAYSKGRIAFFDSGIGGLTTLSACIEYARAHFFNDFDYFYYGDNFRAPYGNLSEEQIWRYADEAFSIFQQLEVCAAVIACNTVTAVCADRLRRKYGFPIVGLEPAVGPAIKQGGEIFVLATKATCSSGKFKNLCEKFQKEYPSSNLRVFPCEGLAGAIEKNWGERIVEYSALLPRGNPDGVVLGCTHYIYIRKEIEAFYGCPTYDGNEGAARRLFTLISSSKNNLNSVQESSGKSNSKTTRCEKTDFQVNLQPLVTTIFSSENANKSSRIYFIGGGQVVNKTKYEQMFVLK